MAKFMMILHESTTATSALSPKEIEKIIGQYKEWRDRVATAGRLIGGEKLQDEGGKRLSLAGGKTVVRDGPYAEAKEIIGGYFIIQADNYDEAVSVSEDCPHLAFGGTIELRQIEEV